MPIATISVDEEVHSLGVECKAPLKADPHRALGKKQPRRRSRLRACGMRPLVPALCFAFVGCGGGDGDDSGDDGGDECSEQSDTCDGESICIDGFCEAAFGREYSITDIDVEVPTTDSNGDAWDVGGGAPDLFVEVYVNDVVEDTSATEQDSFTAFFPGPFTAELIAGNDLTVIAFDEDLTFDDPAYGCTASPITAAMLRGRAVFCSSAGGSMTFTIQPR